MGRTVTSPLSLGQAGITTQDCFLWFDQNHIEPAVLSNGPGRGEGRESPFIRIRAGRVRGGRGETENLALIPGEALFSVRSGIGRNLRTRLSSGRKYHRGLELLLSLEGRWAHDTDGRISQFSYTRKPAQRVSLLKPQILPFYR